MATRTCVLPQMDYLHNDSLTIVLNGFIDVGSLSERRGDELTMEKMRKRPASPRGSLAVAVCKEPEFRGYRRLDWNEVVYHGDYVADEHQQLKLWEGLSGFRAGSFTQSIYRKAGVVRPERVATSHRVPHLKTT